MKKLISILLCAFILVSALPSFAMDSAASGDYEYFLEAQELLVGIGCQSVTSKKDNPISRDAWLNLVTEYSFYDNVSRQNLAGAGIHSGTNYYFYPDESIQVKDAVIMLVKLLGYQPGVEHQDSVYINAAMRLGIDDGINAAFDDDVTYEMAYILLYNYLRANTAEFNITSDNVTIQSGKTNILSQKYDIIEVYGQVTDTPSYSVSGTGGMGDGFLSIDGVRCQSSRYNGDEYFGRYVTAYVKNYGKSGELVAMTVDDESTVTVINSDYSPVYDNGVITYYTQDNKQKSINISIYAAVYLNGERFSFGASPLISASSTITIVDNNKYADGADVVVVENTVDVLVGATDFSQKKIYSKDSPGITYTFSNDTTLITPDGVSMDFDSIVSGDIITLWLMSDASVWKAMLCTDTISGTISEIGSDYVIIDGSAYKFSPSRYELFKDKVSAGKTVDAIINSFGQIAHLTTATAVDGNVGVMMECAYNISGFNESMKIKIFDEAEDTLVYPVSKKAQVNGNSCKTYAEIFAALPKLADTGRVRQTLIIYKLSEEGEIISIEYASDVPMDTSADSNLYVTKATETSDDATGKYKRYSKFLGHNLMVEPSSTVLFRFPKQSDDGDITDDDGLYSASKLIAITSGTIYSNSRIVGYSLDPQSKIARYVTVEYDASAGSGDATTVSGDIRLSMVGSIKQCIHNDVPVEAIEIYNQKNVGGVTVYGKTQDYFTNLGIKAGDLIRVSYNSDTMIAKATELVWSRGSATLANFTYNYGGEGTICDVRYCKLFKRWGETIDLFYKDEDLSLVTTDDAMVFRADLYVLFRYNEKLGKVENFSYDELIGYDIAADNCSEVILETRYRDPMSIFLVK